jgi:hypothetical protein
MRARQGRPCSGAPRALILVSRRGGKSQGRRRAGPPAAPAMRGIVARRAAVSSTNRAQTAAARRNLRGRTGDERPTPLHRETAARNVAQRRVKGFALPQITPRLGMFLGSLTGADVAMAHAVVALHRAPVRLWLAPVGLSRPRRCRYGRRRCRYGPFPLNRPGRPTPVKGRVGPVGAWSPPSASARTRERRPPAATTTPSGSGTSARRKGGWSLNGGSPSARNRPGRSRPR